MTGLIRAEVRRLFSRRAFRLFTLLALLVIVFAFGRQFLVSDRDVEGARRRAVAELQRDAARQHDQCERLKASGKFPSDFECPTPDSVGFFDVGIIDPRFHAASHLVPVGRAVAVGMAIIGFVVGATFVGAEWNAGTMQALLFWEPRRRRVLLAKALALVGGLLVVTTALEVVTYGLTMLVATTRGTTVGVTASLHRVMLLSDLRAYAVIVFTALLGFTVAGLARVTAAALAVAFGYFVVLENLTRVLRPGWQRFLVSENVTALLLKRTPVSPAHVRHRQELDFVTQYVLRGQRAALTLGLYLAALLGAFLVSFSRRDVT